jgi:acetolactate synthase-1/2/3 large subunit
MAIPQVGYDINEFAREAKIAVVDIDPCEIDKYKDRYSIKIAADAGDFINQLISQAQSLDIDYSNWQNRCNEYKAKYPWVNESDHPDFEGFINSYPFMDKLNHYFKEDQLVVTDMGTALLSGHQVLKFAAGQRLMTSTGLGEMGYGLPGAIGASFARNKGEVMCLNCDGSAGTSNGSTSPITHQVVYF